MSKNKKYSEARPCNDALGYFLTNLCEKRRIAGYHSPPTHGELATAATTALGFPVNAPMVRYRLQRDAKKCTSECRSKLVNKALKLDKKAGTSRYAMIARSRAYWRSIDLIVNLATKS